MTGDFILFWQFFHIKILADFSQKIAKSIEFTLHKTHICIFFPIVFQKNHCLMIIHLRGPFFLSLDKEGGRGGFFFVLIPNDVPQSVPKVCQAFYSYNLLGFYSYNLYLHMLKGKIKILYLSMWWSHAKLV